MVISKETRLKFAYRGGSKDAQYFHLSLGETKKAHKKKVKPTFMCNCPF